MSCEKSGFFFPPFAMKFKFDSGAADGSQIAEIFGCFMEINRPFGLMRVSDKYPAHLVSPRCAIKSIIKVTLEGNIFKVNETLGRLKLMLKTRARIGSFRKCRMYYSTSRALLGISQKCKMNCLRYADISNEYDLAVAFGASAYGYGCLAPLHVIAYSRTATSNTHE